MDDFILANDVEAGLKQLLIAIDADVYENEQCTIIIGNDVFHFGGITEHESKTEAVSNMTFGIHKLMTKFYN